MTNPDFVALAKACGVEAFRVEKASDLPAAMKRFMEFDNTKPIVMECRVHTNEHVYPMVPAGASLSQFIAHPKLRDNKA